MALVFGIICFIPFLGVLGIVFGIAGLIVINRSRGRLAGTGMAIAGLILGLLFTALWGAIAIGMSQALSYVVREIVKPTNQFMQAVDQKDYATARQVLDATGQSLATDEAFAQFGDAIRGELGAFKGIPESWSELFAAYGEIGPLFQAAQNMQGPGRQDGMIPVPVRFENGNALLFVWFEPPKGKQQPGPTAPGTIFIFQNVTLITPSHKAHNLIDPALVQAPVPGVLPPTAPTTPDAPPADPATPDAPTPEGEKAPEGEKSGGGN